MLRPERLDPAEMPEELEPELFGYRKPSPENEAEQARLVAETLGYSSVAALEAAISSGEANSAVRSAWEDYQRRIPERQATNAKVTAYLDRANKFARAIANLEQRLQVVEDELDAMRGENP